MHVVPVDESDCDTGLARTASASGAVQIGVVVIRDRVVYHVGHVIDVDTSGRDIRGDKDVFLAGLERRHRSLALLLIEVAVHGGGVESAVVELFDELRGCPLRAGEDDGLPSPLGLENSGDDLVLIHRVGAVDDVLDVGLSAALIGIRRTNVNGPVHEATRQGHDRAGHRGGEQHGVAGRVGLRKELLNVGEEPQVEHLVGLVEHHHRDVLEREHPLAGEVEEATGGSDDDLGTGLQLLDLALIGLTAVDRGNLGATIGRCEHEVLGHLDAQLTGRYDDERFHARRGVEAERLKQGESETEGLAGSRLCLADDVLATESHGDRLCLDREGFNDALGGERVNHVLVDAERYEGNGI